MSKPISPIPPDKSPEEAFWKALEQPDTEAVRKLLEDHPEFIHIRKPDGATPLHASRVEHIDLLLARGCLLDAADEVGNTPLDLALLKADAAASKLLLAKGAEPDPEKATPEYALALSKALSEVFYDALKDPD